MLPAAHGMTWTWSSVDLERTLRETASDRGPPCLLLIWDVKCLHIVIFYSVFGTVQILIVLQGVHGMTRVCSVWTDGSWRAVWTLIGLDAK